MIDIYEQFKMYEIAPKGVIHIGAHVGSEVEQYLMHGFSKVLLIEANPVLSDQLLESTKGYHQVRVVNAALTNFNGMTDFYVSSFDQSSSLLKMKDHKNIYPHICEVGKIRVKARTLDMLLFEQDLNPFDFNFINIDIQGAELLAFSGAIETLRHIEAINTEINLLELYEGCALSPQVESFLQEHGFNRTKQLTPHHPSWGDAFYVRRPRLTMSTLGVNGRFGNAILQYMFLTVATTVQNAVLQTPKWIGSLLFSLDDPVPHNYPPEALEINSLFHNEEAAAVMLDASCLLGRRISNLPSIDLKGFFQVHSKEYIPFKAKILNKFSLEGPIFQEFRKASNLIRGHGLKIVGVHLRRGDYGYDLFYRAPCLWYEKLLVDLCLSPKEYAVYLSTEQPSDYHGRFPSFLVFSSISFGIPPQSTQSFIFDFFMLAVSDILAISNSTFSFSAALINTSAKQFFRPNYNNQALIEFDPWDSFVLENCHLSPSQHQNLLVMD
jgi:FkbM family methyltransferase